MPFFEYKAVTAKCRCLYGNLLTARDYENLLKCREISDIASYLREKTAYGEFLEETDLKKINRNKLEYYIKKSMLSDYLKMYRFTSGGQRRFISLLMAKYEFEYILRVWRDFVLRNTENASGADRADNINNTEKTEKTSDGDYVFNEKFLEIQAIYQNNPRIDLEALKNITTAEQFISAIKNTEYFYIFEKHINDDISKNFTQIEAAVYDEYYKILYEGAGLFDKKSRDNIREAISARADLINLCRIYRLAFNFNTPPEEITPMLVPLRGRLRPGDINALVNSADKDRFMAYCQENLYYGRKQDFRGYDSMSAYMNFYLYKYHKSKKNMSSSGFDVVARYFSLKEFELINLFYLTEGIRYKMPPEYIRDCMYGLDDPDERGRI